MYKKTTSKHLMEAINTFCIGKGSNLQNVRFVGLDGCNTMSGKNKVLQRRIGHISPLSVYVNCRNHKLALCFVHMMKNNELLVDVDMLLISIWKIFHYSPQKAAVFETIQEVYGQRPIKFIRAATTRWLSHLKACSRFITRYETLVDTLDTLLQSTHVPELVGIRDGVLRKSIVATILVLADTLKPVNLLSLYLQEDGGTFTELPNRVKMCIDELNNSITQYKEENYDGLEYRKCSDMFHIIDERTELSRRMRNHNQEQTPKDYLHTYEVPLVYSLVEEIKGAFSIPNPVLAAFSFLEPKNLPDSISDIGNYGKDNAKILAEFYGSACRCL